MRVTIQVLIEAGADQALRTRMPSSVDVTSTTVSATSSPRLNAPPKPKVSSAQSRLPYKLWSQVAIIAVARSATADATWRRAVPPIARSRLPRSP